MSHWYKKRTKTYRRLNRAFHLMRRRGLIAKANYECCSSCAGYGITNEAVKLIDSGKRTKDSIKGCCYYHGQDNEIVRQYLYEERSWRRCDPVFPKDSMMLRYGPLDSQEHGEIGLSTKEVGMIVCDCLMEAGVKFAWEGDPGRCIEIDVVSACEPYDEDQIASELKELEEHRKELSA